MAYIPYVNIKHGTKSTQRFSAGNTLPMTQLPFAMAGFAPQTMGSRGTWFYHPEDHSLEGIRLTHQPSPWIGDYGHFVLMPQSGPLCAGEGSRWSGYRPGEAVLRPDYLQVDFLRYRAALELTPTERGAAIRVDYRRPGPARFAVLPVKGEFSFRLDVEARRLTGWTNAATWSIADNFKTYFVLEFDCDLLEEETYITHSSERFEKSLSGSGEGVGIFVGLAEKAVNVRLAISYISEEQALRNLRRECGDRTFEELRQAAADTWEQYLGKIEVETETEEQKKTFYSCLYRMFLYPHKFHEPDENGEPIHYDSYGGGVKPGVLYTDNGFWDTFRTVYPMYAIIAPDRFAEILQGYVNIYKDSGWLPKWPSASEVGMMPGTLIDAVIAEAVVRGVGSRELWEEAYAGMLKHATVECEDQRYGRHGTADYNKYGYIPREKYHECVNHTLDYVYGDFCLAQVARALGHDDVAERYEKSSGNYRKLFDPATGFMRGRDVNGEMAPDFDPFIWGGEYTEGGPWQSSFAVHHDIDGLAALYGGREQMLAKLDELFATPPLYTEGGYGNEIHEMTEMAAIDFGQCAISNQPSFHLPYLFAALGEQEKTDYWVRRLVTEAFSSADDGFPGDEDNGTMSAWYIFSCLGFYPLCPGKAEYVPGVRLVKDAKLCGRRFHLENGQLVLE